MNPNLNEFYRRAAIRHRRRVDLGDLVANVVLGLLAALAAIFGFILAVMPYAFMVFIVVVIVHFVRKFW